MAKFRRCWHVVLLGLIVTVALGLGATKVVPLQYQAKATYVVLPSAEISGPAGGNPYLAVGEGLDITVGVLGAAMTDAQTQQELAKAGATGGYAVTLDAALPGPVVLVTATGKTPEAATRTLDLVGQQMSKVLTRLQLGVGSPTKFLLSASKVSQSPASPLRKTELRAVLVAVAIGVLLTYLAVTLVDRWSLRRRTRTSGEHRVRGSAGDDLDSDGGADEGEDPWQWDKVDASCIPDESPDPVRQGLADPDLDPTRAAVQFHIGR